MFSLSHVIALLVGSLARLVKVTVRRMQNAGPVLREPITKTGNDFSAQTMLLQHLWLPAKPQPKKNRKAAQRISVASKNTSKKQPLVLTVKSPQEDGSSIQIPVFKTRQPVSQGSKAKQKPAERTKAASKPTQGKAPAQTRTVRRHGVDGK